MAIRLQKEALEVVGLYLLVFGHLQVPASELHFYKWSLFYRTCSPSKSPWRWRRRIPKGVIFERLVSPCGVNEGPVWLFVRRVPDPRRDDQVFVTAERSYDLMQPPYKAIPVTVRECLDDDILVIHHSGGCLAEHVG